jgi:glutamate N-acetyltransferase/amino-acid N-acetyltransferase
MQNLARKQVMDGEGATKFVDIRVDGAADDAAAKQLAEAVANSLLCKTAWFGCDPNWGRIVAALGYAHVPFDPDKVDIFYDDKIVVRKGGDAGRWYVEDYAARF